MLTTKLSNFRKDIKSYLDKVTQSFETLIIYLGKDTGVVVMSLEAYNSIKNTQHELSSSINQQRLDESIEALKSGKKLIKRNLILIGFNEYGLPRTLVYAIDS
jgi:antitoxin YefM